tara:strand:- start:641 stop:3304 length:2664 start_codon:yes stop_codon:yes gene_type:complete
MATYVNDLRLKEIGTGESSGTWGTETNTNLELIGEALGYGTEGITTNADTHATTVADGSTDPGRAMYIKYTGTLDSACTITIGPNTLSRVHIIENATSGSQNIIIKQGSGAEVTIANGFVKAVYLDGAGAGAAVVEAFDNLSVGTNFRIGNAAAEDTAIIFDGNAQDFYIGLDDSADDLIIGKGSTVGTTPAISIDEDLKSTLAGQVVIDPADGVADDAYALFVRNNEATDGRNYGLVVRAGSTSADESFSVRDHANASTYFKVRGDGNVGVGVAAPTLTFQTNTSATGTLPTDGTVGVTTANSNILIGAHNESNSATYSGIALETRTTGASRWLIANEWKGTYLGDLVFDRRTGGSTSAPAMRVDSTGRVLIGGIAATSADTLYGGIVPTLQVEGTDVNTSSIGMFRNSNDTAGPILSIGKSRGTAVNSDTIVQSGDITGIVAFTGADGGERMRATAAIKSFVDGTPGDNDMPGRLSFWTTPDGGYDEVERVRINNSGNVAINAIGSAAWDANYRALDLGGAAYLWANVTGSGGFYLSQNTVWNGSNYVATATGLGTSYLQGEGTHRWYNAASVSAGATQTVVEIARINDNGAFIVGNGVGDVGDSWDIYRKSSTAGRYGIMSYNTSGSFNNWLYGADADRAASTAYYHFVGRSNVASAADNEYLLRGDGNAFCDGSWTGGGADYAEYFEWKDGNSDSEDRRGYSVVLDGNMIRKATSDDEKSSILGIVSAAPAVIGDGDTEQYKQKYLKDDFGSFIWEEHTSTEWTEITYDATNIAKEDKIWYETDKIPSDVTPPSEDVKDSEGRIIKTKAVVKDTEEDGTTKLKRRKLNPDYDPSKSYETRESRKEWDTIGLMGKLRMRKGQPTGDRWIKMKDISDTVEEWLVR